jgi:DNA-binding NarL/FixJ family response regulator
MAQMEIEQAGMAKIRVLIVDDSPCMRDSLRTALSFDPALEIVGEAIDGAEAVKMAAHLQPDVVLVDLEMPLGDGYVSTQELTERRLARAVVALSIHSDAASRARARAAGATVFLPKGTPIGPLATAVRRAGEQATPRRAGESNARRAFQIRSWALPAAAPAS